MSLADADVIVLGLGGVGAATVHALAARGARVLGFDRFGRGHDRGSSHGGTRITRHATFEHPDYVPLLRVATAGFEALEAETGVPLLERCGVLLVGEQDSPVLRGSLAAARQHGVPVEPLDAATMQARYPQLAIAPTHHGLLEPEAGFVRPEAAVRAFLAAAEDHGARLFPDSPVEAWEDGEGGVVVEAAGRRWSADALVIALGAWTGATVPALAPLLRVTRQVQAWIVADDPALARLQALPCWLVDRGAGLPHLYGIPADPLLPGPPMVKLAVHGSERDTDPNLLERRIGKAERAALARLAATWLPGLPGPLLRVLACMYTSTPDGHLILDRVPGAPHSWVVAGLSGHGFKLTPVLGVAAADLALTGRTELPVGFLGLSRFAGAF